MPLYQSFVFNVFGAIDNLAWILLDIIRPVFSVISGILHVLKTLSLMATAPNSQQLPTRIELSPETSSKNG
jgi:hypothetical protein